MKKIKSTAMAQVELSKRGERKLMQDMHKPMTIPNKKKAANKNACRKYSYSY